MMVWSCCWHSRQARVACETVCLDHRSSAEACMIPHSAYLKRVVVVVRMVYVHMVDRLRVMLLL